MKKISPNVLVALMAVGMLAACTKSELSEDIPEVNGDSTVVSTKTKKFTFTLKGDFTSEWKMVNKAPHRTAGYLAADGKDMTDVWVLDYVGGVLQQQLHQDDNTAEDFGQPTMNLAYGNHHIYFIASRGQSPTLDTENHLVTFTKVLDTFYKDYEVSVVSTSNGNRAVTLDRVITRLRLTFTDAVDAEAATINITPHTWYYGWDYVNGVPADTKTDYTTTIDIPSNKLGTTGLQVNLYGFSSATQWTTDVSVNSKKADQTVIGSATISDVPLKANRISELSGPLFSSGGAMTLSLNSTWDDAYEGTW